MILLYTLFIGCAGGMYGGMYKKEEEMEKYAPPAEKETEIDIEESPMVSEREEAGTSPEELAYVPVMPEDRKRCPTI